MLLNLSLAGIRQSIYDRRSTASSGTSQDTRINRAINSALQKLASDVPEALQPSTLNVVLHPDIVSSDASVKAEIAATADSRVLKLTQAGGAALSASAGTWVPAVDRTWDGLMHLEVTTAGGNTLRRQARDWWFNTGDNHYYVSIDKPWPNATDTGLAFRIFQPYFYLPSNVMRSMDALIYDSSRRVLKHVDPQSKVRWGFDDYQGNSKGPPERYFRQKQFQLQAPRLTPAAQHHVSTAWSGPMPQGIFEIYYTIVWGRMGDDHISPEGVSDPLFESAPSPPLTFDATQDPNALVISTLNVDAMAGFEVQSTLRVGRSGYRIRIYVGRKSVAGKGLYFAPYSRIESSGIPYLLAEVDPTAIVGTSNFAAFTWTGAIIPDYERPMPHSTGHYGYSVYPHQDARYEVDVPVLQAPRPLLDDQDTPPIRQEAYGIFVESCLYYAALLDGNDQEGAQIHQRRYEKSLRKFRHRYANPAAVVEAVPFSVDTHTGRRLGRFTDE